MGKEMTAKKSTTETTDIDYAEQAVPKESRKGFVSMFMIMLGFTFFSASMWVGQQLAEGLDFWGFLGSLILEDLSCHRDCKHGQTNAKPADLGEADHS